MPRYTLHPNTKTALWLVMGTLACVTAVVAMIQYMPFVGQQTSDDTLVFMRHDGMDMEIVTVNADGSGETQLTNNDYEDWAAVWTPDKSKIVFHSNRDGYYAVYSMDRDGSNVQRITPEGIHAQFPSVSPDGRMIAYEVYQGEGNNWDIFVSSIYGGCTHQITFSQAHEGGAAWSPDGQQIGYHSTENGYYDIYVVNLDGSGTQRMTFEPETMDVWPQWSPDGSQIIFHSERDGDSEIFIMDADGRNQRNLTNNTALDRVPRFSPDGEQIFFRSERDGESSIYVMDLDTERTTPVMMTGSRDMHPDS